MNVYSVQDESLSGPSKSSSFIDKEQFLKILIAQMKYQNPLQPLKPDELLSQLSQLTQVEQLQNIYRSIEALKEAMDGSTLFNFASLLGKKVGIESQFMTKGDELYVKPAEEYDKVIILVTDIKTGEKREVIMEKGEPLVYRHEGENSVYVSAYALRGNRIIACEMDLFRVVRTIETDEEGKVKLVFEDGQSVYLKEIKRVK